MFEMSGLSSVGNVGARNAEEAKIILKRIKDPADRGGYRFKLRTYGRTGL